MAQITGEVQGLQVEIIDDAETRADDLTPVEELCYSAISQLRQRHPKAAMSALVDAVNMLAMEHGFSGGAHL